MRELFYCRCCDEPCRIGEAPSGDFILLDATPRAGEDGEVGYALASPGRIVAARDRIAWRPHWPSCRAVHASYLQSIIA